MITSEPMPVEAVPRTKATTLGITVETMRRLLAQPKPADLIALIGFLAYTARRQRTASVRATVSFIARGLGWSASKVQRCKSRLLDLGVIEAVVRRDSRKRVTGHFVRVNYLVVPASQNSTCGDLTDKCLTMEDEMLGDVLTVACQRPDSVEEVLASGYSADICYRFIHFNNRQGWKLRDWRAALKAFAANCNLSGASPLPRNWTPEILSAESLAVEVGGLL